MPVFPCESCRNPVEAPGDLRGELARCALCGADQIVPDPVLLTGSRVDCYRIDGALGANPIWASYAARGVVEGRERGVVLKTPTRFLLKNISSPAEFGEMVASHGAVGIPGFHRLLDWSLEEGCSFFAFEEYGESHSLNEIKGSLTPFDVEVALEIALRLATALGHLWDRRRVTHQNLKPRNIRLSKNSLEINILNLGLSKYVLSQPGLLQGGVSMWDVRYMSPEFAKEGRGDTPLCDIYSLGCVLFLLLTGCSPREGLDMDGVMEAGPLDPLAVNPSLDPKVGELVKAMTQMDAGLRIGSWRDALKGISGLLAPAALRGTKSRMAIDRFKKASITAEYNKIRLPPAEASDVAIELKPDKALKVSTRTDGWPRRARKENRGGGSALERTCERLTRYKDELLADEGVTSWRILLLTATAGALFVLLIGLIAFALLHNPPSQAGRGGPPAVAVAPPPPASDAVTEADEGDEVDGGPTSHFFYNPRPERTGKGLESLMGSLDEWSTLAAARVGGIHDRAFARRQRGHVVLYLRATDVFAAKSSDERLMIAEGLLKFWRMTVAEVGAARDPGLARVAFYDGAGKVVCGSKAENGARIFDDKSNGKD